MAKKEIAILRKQNKLFLLLFLLQFSTISFSQNFWQEIPYPDSTWGLALNVERNDHIFFGNWEEPAGLYISDPELIDWEYCNSTRVQPFDMAFNNNDVLFLACNDYIFRTSDMGNTFDTLHHSVNNYTSVEIDDSDGIWVGCWGHILFSDDNGNNWDTLLSTSPSEVFNDFAFGLNGEVYAVSSHFTAPDGGFYRSMDNGLNWGITGLCALNAKTVDVNTWGDIFVGCYFDGVFRSTDNGLKWTNVKNGIDAVSIIIDNENTIFCANAGQTWVHNLGVHFSTDNGQTWDTLNNSGLSNNYLRNIYIDNRNYLYAIGSDYTHQLFRTLNPWVDIEEKALNKTTVSVFPNPATQHSTFIFSLAKEARMEIIVFDQLGRTSLSSGNRTYFGGNHKLRIDVSSLPQGIYYYTLIVDGYISDTGKLIKMSN